MPAGQTPNWGLLLIDPSQAQPEVKLNYNLQIIDAHLGSGASSDSRSQSSGADGTDGQTGPPGRRGRDGVMRIISTHAPYPLIPLDASWQNPFGAIALPASDLPIFVPDNCTLKRITILCLGGPGSCVIALWKSTYGSYPPTSANDITGGANITISAASKYDDSTLAGYTGLACSAGDSLIAHLISSSNFTMIALKLTLGR